MKNVYLKEIQRVILLTWGVVLCSCNGLDVLSRDNSAPSGGEEVVLGVGRSPQTRTVYDDDTKSFAWQNEDKVFVWAKSASGSYALENTAFSLLARPSDGSSAYFTATLASPMEEGTYSYYVAYPAPSAVSGTTVTFTVPAVQDGTASGDIDILLSQPVQGGALQALEEGTEPVSKDVMSVKMKHLLHYLRFYIPEGCNTLGEPVSYIEFTMPQAIAGQLNVDVTDASTAALSGGVSTMTLKLAETLTGGSSAAAVVGIVPPSAAYSEADRMTVKLVSENKWATVSPSLNGRTFTAGHITSVPLRLGEARDKFSLKFTLASNNLGEDPQKITLTLADGSVWPDGTSSAIIWEGSDGGVISVGDAFYFKTADEAAFRALSSKSVTVSYESESAIVSETLSLGDLSSGTSASVSLNCPYLFFEDFSTVESFNSNDEWTTETTDEWTLGVKDPKVFNGWSVARAGAQAGTAIRLAARRETNLAHYSARADSPFLSGLKEGKTVNLDIQFNYSMGRQETNSKAKTSQTVYFGYTTTEGGIKSGNGTGVSLMDMSTYTDTFSPDDETSGSYTNINKLHQATLTDVQAPLRLSWITVTQNAKFLSSGSFSTCWLYIDNIKVKIKK
jgi:hypothetical protein